MMQWLCVNFRCGLRLMYGAADCVGVLIRLVPCLDRA